MRSKSKGRKKKKKENQDTREGLEKDDFLEDLFSTTPDKLY